MENPEITYEKTKEIHKELKELFFNDPEKFIIEQTLFAWAKIIYTDVSAEELSLMLQLLTFLRELKEIPLKTNNMN